MVLVGGARWSAEDSLFLVVNAMCGFGTLAVVAVLLLSFFILTAQTGVCRRF